MELWNCLNFNIEKMKIKAKTPDYTILDQFLRFLLMTF
jgi:hypothetical protein